jgi:hypothetical protein
VEHRWRWEKSAIQTGGRKGHMSSNNKEENGKHTEGNQCASSQITPNIEAELENRRELNK